MRPRVSAEFSKLLCLGIVLPFSANECSSIQPRTQGSFFQKAEQTVDQLRSQADHEDPSDTEGQPWHISTSMLKESLSKGDFRRSLVLKLSTLLTAGMDKAVIISKSIYLHSYSIVVIYFTFSPSGLESIVDSAPDIGILA